MQRVSAFNPLERDVRLFGVDAFVRFVDYKNVPIKLLNVFQLIDKPCPVVFVCKINRTF